MNALCTANKSHEKSGTSYETFQLAIVKLMNTFIIHKNLFM